MLSMLRMPPDRGVGLRHSFSSGIYLCIFAWLRLGLLTMTLGCLLHHIRVSYFFRIEHFSRFTCLSMTPISLLSTILFNVFSIWFVIVL